MIAVTSGGAPVERNVAWPAQRWTPFLPRCKERTAILGHFIISQFANDRSGQNFLDKEILLENHLLASWRSHRLKGRCRRIRPFRPGHWPDQCFHIGNAPNRIAVHVGPMEAQCAAPVMNDEGHLAMHPDLIEQLEQIIGVFGKVITVRAAVRKLFGITHTDQVRRNAPTQIGHMGHDVAPEITGGWVAMQKDDGVTRRVPHLHIGHATTVDGLKLLLCPSHISDHP